MRALLGVSDRRGLPELAAGLVSRGAELIATDGTRRALAEAGIAARSVAEVTGFPEMLGGRVKTLHPAIHAGILARRDSPDQLRQLADHGFAPIDLVVVNLYPFEETVARGASPDEIIEQIDIGGPALIRAAAKNSGAVAVVVSPAQYSGVLDALARGGIDAAMRSRLAAEAFAHVAAYDAAVAQHLASVSGREERAAMPAVLSLGGRKLHDLRYGENPHQLGALYGGAAAAGLAGARRLQGPELSFTNWLDSDAARAIVSDFDEPAAVIVKHTNPCGFSPGETLVAAYGRAVDCDPRSAFGGVVGVNRPLDRATATAMLGLFLEVVVAPAVDPDAQEVLTAKPRLRVLAAGDAARGGSLDVRSIDGGMLVQTADRVDLDRSGMSVPTRRAPTEEQWRDLLVAWRLCRHVTSNAIVIVRDGMAVGVGAGQMSRVEAAELAVARSGGRSDGAAAASDAFFPMPDGLETLARSGVSAIIHPGGSRRDAEVVAAADAAGIVMVLAGERHFRH